MKETKPYVAREMKAVIDRVVFPYLFAHERSDREAAIDALIAELNKWRPSVEEAARVVEPGVRAVYIESPPPESVLAFNPFARAIGVAAASVAADPRLEPAMTTEIGNACNEVKRRWTDDLPEV